MKKDLLTESQIMRRKDKNIYKSLVATLLELILLKKVSMIMKNLVRAYIVESIKKQTKESTKKSPIDDPSKRLLKLEFKSNH